MTAALARRPADSLYSFILVALLALAFAMQATFVVGLARGGLALSVPEIVRQGVPAAPCVNG